MRIWGATEEQISSWLHAAKQEQKDFAVWPENWPAVKLFRAVSSQWRIAANGLPYGLDYAGVEACARLSNITLSPALFEHIQIMENAAVQVFQEKRAKG